MRHGFASSMPRFIPTRGRFHYRKSRAELTVILSPLPVSINAITHPNGEDGPEILTCNCLPLQPLVRLTASGKICNDCRTWNQQHLRLRIPQCYASGNGSMKKQL
ncbi:Transcription factor atf21 [Fusarium oxysporum f. sp. albedinis]|nr:Transcription factor atf21 [Fusarium oxysporum f. sp. albedinis]